MSDGVAHEIGAKKRECKTLACAIQTCLRRKDYDEKKCKAEIESWQRCFDELSKLEKNGVSGKARSSSL